MQVFTGLRNLTGRDRDICNGDTRCVVSFTSDQVKALERVYALRNSFNIAAVNMSLGGGRFSGSCAGGSGRPTANAIARLKSVGIFENFNGTSMAAPHVAGAYAVAKQAVPSLTVNQLESLFDSVGPNVSSSGITRKRLDLKAALEELGFGSDAVITPFLDLLLDD